MKAFEGNRCIVPLTLNLGSSCRRLVNITPLPLELRKDTRSPLKRRPGGPKNQTERFGEDKIPFHLMGLKLRAVQPVACQYIDCNVPASQLQRVQTVLHIMQTSIYNF